MSLGNVNTCCTIIINCDHPSIEQPTKLKKNMARKRHVSLLFLLQMFLCSYLYSGILCIKTKRLLC